MQRSSSSSRSSKSQKETHSEIERKRRERMKRDTEFLRRQIGNPQFKDKLSIFQAGAERLIQYTEKIGKRDYIINDEEYTRLIMSGFSGFDVHVRCSDNQIIHIGENVDKILGRSTNEVVGRTLYELAESSSTTKQIIDAALQGPDAQPDIIEGLVARNFILALACGPAIAPHHCVHGSDDKNYRFIEFCGDLCHLSEDKNSDQTTLHFRGLCRPIDPVCGTVVRKPDGDSTGPSHHLTLRLDPNNFRIKEVVGSFPPLVACPGDIQFQHKLLSDLVIPPERQKAELLTRKVIDRSPIEDKLHFLLTATIVPQLCHIRLRAIRVGSHLYAIVCQLTAIYNAHHQSDPRCTQESSFQSCCSVDQMPGNRRQPIDDSTSTQFYCQSTGGGNPANSAAEPSANICAEPSFESEFLSNEWINTMDISGFQRLLNDGRPFLNEDMIDIFPDIHTDM